MDLDISFQPKQLDVARLFTSRGFDSPTVIGYGGALGGGKSGAMRRMMLMRRMHIPNTMGAIVRRVYAELKTNHIDKLFEEFPGLTEYWNSSARELTFPNGSKFMFMWAENETDVMRKFPGPEFYDLYVDQAEQFTEKELLEMGKRVRWPDTPPGECKYGLFFNPGGPGMEYLRRIFYLKEYRDKEQPKHHAFVQAYGWDNYQWFTHLMSEPDFYTLSDQERFELFITQTSYGIKLDGLPKHQRIGALMGSFEEFSGQYFAGAWDEKSSMLTERQAAEIIKPWWNRWMAQDWAFAEHAAHYWFVNGILSPQDWVRHFGGSTDYPMEVVIIYRELITQEVPEADLATRICDMTPPEERKTIQHFYLSQDAFGQRARQVGGHTVGEQYTSIMRRNGMPAPETAYQDRINGHRFMFSCLRQAQLRGTNINEERSKQGPAVFIVNSCVELPRCIPLALRDEDTPDDVARVDGALWEDVVDGVRYGLAGLLGPKIKAPFVYRAKELYASTEDLSPTARAMIMKKFHVEQRPSKILSRGKRWR